MADHLVRQRVLSGLLSEREARERVDAFVTRTLGAADRAHRAVDITTGGEAVASAWCVIDGARANLIGIDRPGEDVIGALERWFRSRGISTVHVDLFRSEDELASALENRSTVLVSQQMVKGTISDVDVATDLVLEPMTAREFDGFWQRAVDAYAEGLLHDGVASPEQAGSDAEKAMREHLPAGLGTENQYLFTARRGTDVIGEVWFELRRRSDGIRAFVLDLSVSIRHRRKGHGASVMRLAAFRASLLGASSMGLHVFGSNSTAITLYEKLGFRWVEQLLSYRLEE